MNYDEQIDLMAGVNADKETEEFDTGWLETSIDSMRIKYMYVDQNGHRHVRGKYEPQPGGGYGYTYPEKVRVQMRKIGDDGEIFLSNMHDLASSCGGCGAYPHLEYVDDDHARITSIHEGYREHPFDERPCQAAEGFSIVTEISVPSGRLIVDDDLRDLYDLSDEDEESFATYNSLLGQKQYVEAINAKHNVAYGPVGNSCPRLFDLGGGKYVIGSAAGGEDEDGDPVEEAFDSSNSLAWVCTDLWAYMFADYGQWLADGGTPIEDEDHGGTRVVIDFPAGRYRITHHTTEAGWEDDFEAGCIYATIERIGD